MTRVQTGTAEKELTALLRRYGEILPEGFSIDLASAPGRWDRCLKRMGTDKACERMARELCRRYEESFGEPFLFTEACVAREIRYHADAYLAVQSYPRYRRPVTTLLFSREAIRRHCGEVNISLADLRDWKQRLVFRYRSGIRECYRKTERDPFRRGRLRSGGRTEQDGEGSA